MGLVWDPLSGPEGIEGGRACMCTNIYVHIYVYTYMYVCTLMRMYTFMYICVHHLSLCLSG